MPAASLRNAKSIHLLQKTYHMPSRHLQKTYHMPRTSSKRPTICQLTRKLHILQAQTPSQTLLSHLAFSSHLASSVDAARMAAHGFIPANNAQVEGWKKVTEAVHEKGSFIFLRLWVLGCVARRRHIRPFHHNSSAPAAFSAIASPSAGGSLPILILAR
ncbi:hypothetical protein CY34DRAFT_18081 [Suillus luteus UH-Slu-Lm8-n1]|uniref:NADH:flavin oxidoreductase/NADH oxidase N-terminal domain-containing protein n=1 Tax=Suillus luteus UH-Slu-Lm8-n1 TaxID=930992 RepID=A0A0D0A6V8_9AGAM|nr:hypothetical protein CY34DRAFT_18081 [Suillus luteus UH-Slu-Lm8-n1]